MPQGSAYHGSYDDHGASVAAWTGVAGLLIASVVIGLGIWLNTGMITAIGVGLAVLTLVVAVGLAKAGFGVGAKRRRLAELREQGLDTGVGHH